MCEKECKSKNKGLQVLEQKDIKKIFRYLNIYIYIFPFICTAEVHIENQYFQPKILIFKAKVLGSNINISCLC